MDRQTSPNPVIPYDRIIDRAMRGVVREALRHFQNGAVDPHSAFLTFLTNYPGVQLPEHVKAQYPETISLVLQHQFSQLVVDEDSVSVLLSFNGVPSRVVIPFASLIFFRDQAVGVEIGFVTEIPSALRQQPAGPVAAAATPPVESDKPDDRGENIVDIFSRRRQGSLG